MSTLAVSSPLARGAAFYSSVVGKKAIMAVTGLMLVGFVIIHMAANLQVFLPPGPDGVHALDLYGEKLRALPPLLWGARLALLLVAVLHIVAAVQLTLLNKVEARPVGYVKKASVGSTYASRTMIWSGPIVLFFLLYHLLHLTLGAPAVHPDFEPGQVYRNVVSGFQSPAVAIFYMVANVLLAIHLQHGIWSLFQSLGFSHPQYTPRLRALSTAIAFIVGAGNVAMPLAVLSGLIRSTGGRV